MERPMKLYKKIFDVEEIIGNNRIFTDANKALVLQKQLIKSLNQYKELWEQNTSMVADLAISQNGITKKLKFISYKDYCSHYITAVVSCFYEELDFLANNIWENNKIW